MGDIWVFEVMILVVLIILGGEIRFFYVLCIVMYYLTSPRLSSGSNMIPPPTPIAIPTFLAILKNFHFKKVRLSIN